MTTTVPNPHRISTAQRVVPDHRRGQIAPMLVILVGVLFMLTGIVLDGGRLQFEKRHMQLAADAAAMGGSFSLMAGESGQDVIDAARDDAELNNFTHYAPPDPSDPNPPPAPAMPTTVEVNNPPLSGPKAGDANFVEVIITKNYPTTFMRVAGLSQAPVKARAVAGLVNYGEGCVLALNPTASNALEVSGGATLDSSCGVQVNSNDPNRAIRTDGGGTIDARPGGIAVYGGAEANGCSGGCFMPNPVTGAPPTRDWLAHVPDPVVPTTLATIYEAGGDPAGEPALGVDKSGGTWYFHPGLYTGSTGAGKKKHAISLSGGTVYLYPGIYFLDSGMKITATTTFKTVGTDGLPGGPGEGVMFYNTTTSDPTKALSWNEIDIVAGPDVVLNPITSGTYKGILFFEGRNSPKLVPGHRITGNLTAEFNGVLYFSKGHLDYAGTTSVGGWTAIIADTINVTGNATLSSNFLADSDGETPFRTAMLVE